MYGRQEQKAKQSALLSEKKTYIVDRNRVADEFIKESENKTINQSNPQNPMEDLYLSGLNFRK
jgi:bifunctional pyridoxal-dependent enzyme with beta-cystathionase and maltose regulon repressor activities